MKLKDKRVLVTGGAGFIGSEVVSQLVKHGAKVTVLDNFSSGKRHYISKHKIKIVKGDITDEKIVAKTVKDQEIIFNLAALPFIPDSYYYPVDFFHVNTIGSLNVAWSSVKSKRQKHLFKFQLVKFTVLHNIIQWMKIIQQHHIQHML